MIIVGCGCAITIRGFVSTCVVLSSIAHCSYAYSSLRIQLRSELYAYPASAYSSDKSCMRIRPPHTAPGTCMVHMVFSGSSMGTRTAPNGIFIKTKLSRTAGVQASDSMTASM